MSDASTERLRRVANRLVLDAAAEDAITALEDDGVAAILLKGASVARTLYSAGERDYQDVDLLVAGSDFDAALASLHRAGFRLRHAGAGLGETGVYARELQRGPVILDLHMTFPGIDVSPESAWRVLSRHRETLLLRTREVDVLDATGRSVIAGLHAAKANSGWALEDLSRMVASHDDRHWDGVIALASELQAVPSFALGLSRVDIARPIVARLGLVESITRAALLNASSVPMSAGLVRLSQTHGTAKLLLVAREFFPTPDGIRYWRPSAAKSSRALLAAYARRPFYLMWNVPRAWMVGRRASGRPGDGSDNDRDD